MIFENVCKKSPFHFPQHFHCAFNVQSPPEFMYTPVIFAKIKKINDITSKRIDAFRVRIYYTWINIFIVIFGYQM